LSVQNEEFDEENVVGNKDEEVTRNTEDENDDQEDSEAEA